MRRIHQILPLFLILLLFGCGPKQIELASPLSEGIGVGEPNTIVMTAGEPLTLPLALPELKKPAQLEIQAQAPLSAAQEGENLVLSCEEPGSYPLTFVLSAEGYERLDIPCQVKVEPRPMAMSVLDENGNPVGSVTLTRGESATFTLVSEEGAAFSGEDAGASPDGPPCDVTVEGDRLTLTADLPGEGAVTLRAVLAGWTDAELSLPVTVNAVPAEFSVSQKSLSGLVGETLTLPYTIDSEGTLWVSCNSKLTATVSDGAVSFTAAEPGNYQVVLTAKAPGDLPATETVTVVYSLPTVSLSAPGSLTLSAGGSTTAAVQATSGASVWVKTSGDISASIGADGVLTVSADRKGSGTVTVGAELEGYQPATATIAVTVNVSLPTASSRYSDEAMEIARLVNAERASQGLKSLTYRQSLEGLAEIRAREASEYWSHTRPDGRDCSTVFDDYDLKYRGEGENLFAGNVLDADVTVDAWMDSADHRANILRKDSQVDGMAVGIYKGRDGDYYICQLFVAD